MTVTNNVQANNMSILFFTIMLVLSCQPVGFHLPPGPQTENHKSEKHIPDNIMNQIEQFWPVAAQVAHGDKPQVVDNENASQDNCQAFDFLFYRPSGKEHKRDGKKVKGISRAFHYYLHGKTVDGKKRYSGHLHRKEEDGAKPIG